MHEVRIDPLTRAEGDRRRRPRGAGPAATSTAAPAGAGRPPAATRSWRATRTGRRRRCTRCAPAAARPTRPAGRVRVVPNLYPALGPAAAGCPRRARPKPDLFAARPRRRARGDRQRARAGHARSPTWSRRRSGRAMDVWRERMRAHADAACRAPDRQRAAARRAPRCPTPTRSSTRSTSCPRRSRASASASPPTRPHEGCNLLGDLVQEEVRRRERVVAIDDEAVLMARSPRACRSSSARPARAARRGSRTTGRSARRCSTTALRRLRAPCSARCRRSTCGCAPRRGAPTLLLADRRRAAARRTSPGWSSAPGSTCTCWRPRGAAARAARGVNQAGLMPAS